jgi:hypothetical protein
MQIASLQHTDSMNNFMNKRWGEEETVLELCVSGCRCILTMAIVVAKIICHVDPT